MGISLGSLSLASTAAAPSSSVLRAGVVVVVVVQQQAVLLLPPPQDVGFSVAVVRLTAAQAAFVVVMVF